MEHKLRRINGYLDGRAGRNVLSCIDQTVTIGLPTAEACQIPTTNTLATLASEYHKIESLLRSREASGLVEWCVGLDGRQIRKAILSALTLDPAHRSRPSHLQIDDVPSASRDEDEQLRNKHAGAHMWAQLSDNMAGASESVPACILEFPRVAEIQISASPRRTTSEEIGWQEFAPRVGQLCQKK